jgi:beta-lactamase regulating signal transducer with metallopeptidase domain
MLFAYCLLMTLLHSLWQAGVLALVYATVSKTLLGQANAGARRNLLLLLVGVQLVLSGLSFAVYYQEPSDNAIYHILENYAVLKPWLYQAAPWLVTLYFAWLGIKIGQMVLAWRQFRVLYKTGLQKAPIDLRLFAMATAEHIGIKRKVQLWLSHTIHTPVTFGFFKPVVLLPVALVNQLSLEQAEALVVHELTHIKANDYLLNWLLTIAETVLGFNPFVRYLCNQAKLEREQYCDANVLHFGKHPVQYAETLLLAARYQQQQLQWQLAATGRRNQLLQRIAFFTSDAPYRRHPSPFRKTLAPLLALAVVGLVAYVTAVLPQQAVRQRPSTVAQSSLVPVTLPIDELALALPLEAAPLLEAPPATPSIAPARPTAAKPARRSIATETDEALTTNALSSIPGETGTSLLLPAGLQNVGFDAEALAREIVVEEENGDIKIMKIFTLQFKDGQWQLTPKIKATSRRISVDTALLRLDSLQIRMVQEQ